MKTSRTLDTFLSRFQRARTIVLFLPLLLLSSCSIALESGVSQTPEPYDFVPVAIEPSFDLGLLQSLIIYPPEAQRLGIQGRVDIRVLVSKTGKPIRSFIESTDSELLNAEATRVAMLITFTPALQQNGQPMDCWVSIRIIFRL